MKKNLFRRSANRILSLMAQFVPGCTTVRPFLHKLRGVKIHGRVFIGDQAYLENEYPECIEIGNEAQIGLRSVIMAHFRGSGKVVIEDKVWIGPHCIIATTPGKTLTIGANSVIGASTVVTSDIPANSFVVGTKPRIIGEVTVPMTLDTTYEEFKKGLNRL